MIACDGRAPSRRDGQPHLDERDREVHEEQHAVPTQADAQPDLDQSLHPLESSPSSRARAARSRRRVRSRPSRPIESKSGKPRARTFDRGVQHVHHLARFQPQARRSPAARRSESLQSHVVDERDHRVEHILRALRGHNFFPRIFIDHELVVRNEREILPVPRFARALSRVPVRAQPHVRTRGTSSRIAVALACER